MDINHDFRVRNYTEGKNKSASLSVTRRMLVDGEESERQLKILVDGHIIYSTIINPNSIKKREKIREKLLKAIGYNPPPHYYDEVEEEKSELVNEIIESLTSGRGYGAPVDRLNETSPSGKTVIEQYEFWFDATPIFESTSTDE